ncbi:MAG TPA: sulfotransferase domain-containing protein [Trebonia sp.]|jgi:hypothetical protein|nr:sulfotransferase domain-containing protein [Trebonia sp.]
MSGRATGRPQAAAGLAAGLDRLRDRPRLNLDSLPGILWHLGDAWARRAEPNVVLIRYDDLCRDLAGAMRALAGRLGIAVPEPAWPGLVRAATFDQMRERSLAPPRLAQQHWM